MMSAPVESSRSTPVEELPQRELLTDGGLGGIGGLLQSLISSGSGSATGGGVDGELMRSVLMTLNGVVAGQREEIRWWRDRYCQLEERYERERERNRGAGEAQDASR